MNTPKVSDIVGIINKVAPPSLAEEWDNVGLQLGDPGARADRIMVSLDPGSDAIKAAVAAGCRLLLTHHPLIFSPLKKIVSSDPLGSDITYALQNNLAVFSLHTNYDMASDGMNDLLARRLDVLDATPLKVTARDELVKLVVFVPSGHEERLLEALFPVGSVIGNYKDCSFRTAGTGTFRPLPGANPFVGSVGKREVVDEVRVELLVRKQDLSRAISALRASHPYEEPAYDLYPLVNGGESFGLGRIGALREAVPLGVLAGLVKTRLQAVGVRFVGEAGKLVKKVAVCGGSGISLLREAAYRGADVLVTGDVKYHDARLAETLGVALIDAGHFATELPMVSGLTQRLSRELAEREFVAEVIAYAGEKEPFSFA